MLIAIAIFSILVAICYSVLSQYIQVDEKIEQKSSQLQQLQKAFNILERDLRYVVDRGVRDEIGQNEPAFIVEYSNGIAGEILRFTTSRPGYEVNGLSELSRVAWYIDGEKLYRDRWSVLDRDSDSQSQSALVLADIQGYEIEQYSWSDSLGVQLFTPFSSEEIIPYGIKITLLFNDGFEYFRVIDMANGS